MNGMNTDTGGEDRLTRPIIGCGFAVANGLGCGLLEKVYENALAYKLRGAGLIVEQQHAVDVTFEGHVVGTYVADLIVNDAVVLELKAVNALNSVHIAQCLDLVKASRLQTCLLLNLGTPRFQVRRLDGLA
jgi:GxxExxY protein